MTMTNKDVSKDGRLQNMFVICKNNRLIEALGYKPLWQGRNAVDKVKDSQHQGTLTEGEGSVQY